MRSFRITLRAKILLLALILVVVLSAAAIHTMHRARLIEAELRTLAEIFVPLDDRFARLVLVSVERDLTFKLLTAVAKGHADADPLHLERSLIAEQEAIEGRVPQRGVGALVASGSCG